METLERQVISGLGWSVLSQGGRVLAQFLVTIVLARLLAPGDFGILAMALVFTEFASFFGDMGLGSALIQKQDATDEHYSTAFWLNMAAGLGLMVIMIACAPLIAAFYHHEELKDILAVLSINFVLVSFSIVQQSLLTKEMEFKKLSIRAIVAVVVSGIISIILAYCGAGVWSLVFQTLGFSFIDALLLWGLSPWRPKFVFSRKCLREMLPFGVSSMGAAMIMNFSRNIDKLLIGRFLGATELGYYSIAYKIMMYPLYHIGWVVSGVMYPTYAKMQTDLGRLKSAYFRVIKGVSMTAFPLAVGFSVIASSFVLNVYGAKWQASIPLVQIMCLGGMFIALGGTAFSMYLALGRADINLRCNVINAVSISACVYAGLHFGLVAVAFIYTVYAIIWAHVLLYVASHILKISYGKLYANLTPAYLLAAGIAAVMALMVKILGTFGLMSLLGAAVAGFLLYVFLLFRFRYLVLAGRRVSLNIQ